MHCKIIRDADKIDNFRVKQEDKFEDMFPKIYDKKTIDYEMYENLKTVVTNCNFHVKI